MEYSHQGLNSSEDKAIIAWTHQGMTMCEWTYSGMWTPSGNKSIVKVSAGMRHSLSHSPSLEYSCIKSHE